MAAGGNSRAALDAACSVEMLHSFSLVHDDLPALDNDVLRRGLPSCHVQFGEAIAILAGDALFALAFSVMGRATPDASINERCVIELADAAQALVRGEVLDVEGEGKELSESELDRIHAEKTAALFAASCAIGALCAKASTEWVDKFRDFGREFGHAFQLADDILNECSSADALGKSAGSDRLRRKATHVALLGQDASRTRATKHVERSLQFLEGVANTEELAELAKFSVYRDR